MPAGKAGLLVAGGSKNAVVATADGARLLYAEEATEVWFADYGSGQLVDGAATVAIDPVFAQTVNLGEPYHVFIQAGGDAELYVSQRTSAGFEVRLRGGDPSAAFSYRLVAKRLGHEGQRLERAPWADADPNLYPGPLPPLPQPELLQSPAEVEDITNALLHGAATETTDGATIETAGVTSSAADHNHWGETWSGTGTGLSLTSSDGSALYGWAVAPSGEVEGVRGVSESTGGSGVYGHGSASSGSGYGVYGYTLSTEGRGVYGYADASSGETYGVEGRSEASSGFGVYGVAAATSGDTYGVVGVSESTGGRGVYGHASDANEWNLGVYGVTLSPDGWAGEFFSDYGNGVYISVPEDRAGLLVLGGTKNAVVATDDGARLLYAEEATEVWFADYGFGQLEDGVAVVDIDPVFAQTVSLGEPYHVFLQAYGDAGLYVSQRTSEAFEVRLRDGDPEAGFSYRLVAKRLGHEAQRLERAPAVDADPNLSLEKAGGGRVPDEGMVPPASQAVALPAGGSGAGSEGFELVGIDALDAGHDHWGASWSGSGTGLFPGSTDSTALYGHSAASSGDAYGVVGVGAAPGGGGVYGYAAAASGQASGAMGQSASDGGSGVYGHCSVSSGISYGVLGFTASTGGRGMYGYASAASGPAYGVMGVSESRGGIGVLGYASAASGTTYGIYGETRSPDGWAGGFFSGSGHGVYISVPTGKVGFNVANGTKNAVVATDDGARLLYVEEATEVWFADYGFGEMEDGVARVEIDPIYAQTVNLEEPYYVFVQAYGDAAVYVDALTAHGFEVRLREGDPQVGFTYRLVAKRVGHEASRLERAPWADSDPNLYPEPIPDERYSYSVWMPIVFGRR